MFQKEAEIRNMRRGMGGPGWGRHPMGGRQAGSPEAVLGLQASCSPSRRPLERKVRTKTSPRAEQSLSLMLGWVLRGGPFLTAPPTGHPSPQSPQESPSPVARVGCWRGPRRCQGQVGGGWAAFLTSTRHFHWEVLGHLQDLVFFGEGNWAITPFGDSCR